MIDSIVKVFRGIAKLRGNSDNTLIGNVGDRLKVDSVQGTPVDRPVVYKSPFLIDGGLSKDMGINGSVTPVEFIVAPSAGEVWFVETVRLTLIDPGKHGLEEFGAGPGLVNGCKFEAKINGSIADTTVLKDNGDMLATATVFQRISQFDEDDIYRYTIHFKNEYVLKGDLGDFLKMTIQDDLDVVHTFTMSARYWKEI